MLILHYGITGTTKIYNSRWTSQVLDELSITSVSWIDIRFRVQGVHVYEEEEAGVEAKEYVDPST